MKRLPYTRCFEVTADEHSDSTIRSLLSLSAFCSNRSCTLHIRQIRFCGRISGQQIVPRASDVLHLVHQYITPPLPFLSFAISSSRARCYTPWWRFHGRILLLSMNHDLVPIPMITGSKKQGSYRSVSLRYIGCGRTDSVIAST